jgi:hypothetical protein
MKADRPARPELRVVPIRDLVASALASLPGFPLVLGFKPTTDEVADWSTISAALPWLHTLGEEGFGTICENLRDHRLAVVLCSTEGARSRLEILGHEIRRESQE